MSIKHQHESTTLTSRIARGPIRLIPDQPHDRACQSRGRRANENSTVAFEEEGSSLSSMMTSAVFQEGVTASAILSVEDDTFSYDDYPHNNQKCDEDAEAPLSQ